MVSKPAFHAHSIQGAVAAMPNQLGPRRRVDWRRGQSIDPHNIAEQQVLSMTRLGGSGALAQLVEDIPLQAVEGKVGKGGDGKQQMWEKGSNDGTECHTVKLMEEDLGTAMQFLQSKTICVMPVSFAATMYHSHHQPEVASVKPEPNAPS